MLDILRKFLGGTPAERDSAAPTASEGSTRDVRFAACVILVELASVDGDFSEVERQRILEILERHFGVDRAGAEQLITDASSAGRKSVDDFTFTRQIVREYDLAQRMVLAEFMWQVVLADGNVAGDESYLMRKFANLLQLDAAFMSEARQRAEGTGPLRS